MVARGAEGAASKPVQLNADMLSEAGHAGDHIDATLELCFGPTPNARKVTVLLAELDASYRITWIDLAHGQQFSDDFLQINPNGRIPALIDHDGPGGEPLHVFESGAILFYLAEKFGRFLAPAGTVERQRTVQWLFWQMANQGPMLGQLNHFLFYAKELGCPEDAALSYAQTRYLNEYDRLLGVMDRHLDAAQYLAGDDYSIADMATFPWLRAHPGVGADLSPFQNLMRWYQAVNDRPAVQTGMDVGKEMWPADGQTATFTDAQKQVMFGQDSSAYSVQE